MPGGLIQLVGKGAQDELVTGNPSFSHFRSVYKRHTDFAMEHVRLDFRTSTLELPNQGTRTMRVKVDRNAQLLHDCQIRVSLPDIYSPVAPITPGVHPEVNHDATAIGQEFQWIPNLGYNMIRNVSVLINGSAIVTHTGEWMKLYSYTTHDANKREIVDRMVGHVVEMNDPANANGCFNQYPHAITTATTAAQPSIAARDLVIPLHFWFCEDVGSAIPLVALQQSEVEIVVEFNNVYSLFTVLDVRDNSPTFGKRIAPDLAAPEFSMDHFLSPPLANGAPSNTTLKTWSANPFVEANYIFLADAETIHLAKSDNAFKFKEVRLVQKEQMQGAGNDVELTMVNLCTRLVWVAQRSDVASNNGVDNQTNWANPNLPLTSTSPQMTPWYSSGNATGLNIRDLDPVVDSVLILDGAERFNPKQRDFFTLLQNYRHHSGKTTGLPGVHTYSFALDHHNVQPSGSLNGSQFNKTILRMNLIEPPPANTVTSTQVCVFKNTALDANPVVVINPAVVNPEEVVSVVNKPVTQVRAYTYNTRVHVESYNFLRVVRGIANVVFSS